VVRAVACHEHTADREADKVDRDPTLAPTIAATRMTCVCAAASRCGLRLLASELKRRHPHHPRPTDEARLRRPGSDVGYRLGD
jgi:hypothetical protein